jgi:glycosyltransferase involved in cell wall biosynthesis
MVMISTPKISIITPCYNAAQYIEQTILSIINQDYDNIEYIIIDGGSTDGTVDIIKKYEDKVTYWISEPDNGQSDAINKGIAIATGDVFNWVNGDDYLEDGALKLVGDSFHDLNLDVLCTSTMLFNESGNIRINNPTEYKEGLISTLNSQGLNQQGMFWRMDRIKELNGVNSKFNYSMDLDLWKRYIINYGFTKLSSLDVVTGFFRLSNDSKTGADFDANFHLFENENNAALIQYARCLGEKAEKGMQFLYPIFDLELSKVNPVSILSEQTLNEWVNELFYLKAKRFFYAEDFKSADLLLRCINSKYIKTEEKRNFHSYKRWSFIKKFITK